jgi:NAD(P)-dependent dehydrogenase (short-subunit alcohol dehydrogenase family)
MDTFIVTGASHGFGLEIARQLVRRAGTEVILAVRDLKKGEALAKEMGPNARAMRLDCASMEDINRFIAAWRGPIRGLVNNAGLQQPGATRLTADGYEETIAVNHLAAFQLTVGLLPHLKGGRVLFIGSGTHNPENKTPRRFGFRGAKFTSIAQLAKGESDATNDRQRGLDRYATSKFLNTATGIELARRFQPTEHVFSVLDPGMMAGTGLARSAPAPVRLLWSTVLKWISPLIDDASTTEKSAAAAVWMLTEAPASDIHGAVYDFARKPSERVWEKVREAEVGRMVVEQSLSFLHAKLPT